MKMLAARNFFSTSHLYFFPAYLTSVFTYTLSKSPIHLSFIHHYVLVALKSQLLANYTNDVYFNAVSIFVTCA